jgi:oligopeptide transport system substrate-binding protein
VTGPMRRRTLLAAGPLALAGCRTTEGAYFGKTEAPKSQRLVVLLAAEPGSLDPATSTILVEDRVIYALFEGLTTLHPLSAEAMAGLATHYELSTDALHYTFFLRGHPGPRGIRLANRDVLPREYSHGVPATPDATPAMWSDGVRLTAHDVVYSWRRLVDPATPAMYAYLAHHIVNAEEINSGKLPADRLAVVAIDDFTLQVDLRAPVPFFLELIASKSFCSVARHVIESVGPRWTEPGRIVTSGAFSLRERHYGEKLVLARNPQYYESAHVWLEELVFLPVIDSAASANLYRTAAAAMTATTPTLISVLQRKKDYRPTRLFGAMYAPLKSTKPPFNDVRLRYAFNMATDKRSIAAMIPGQTPSVNLVPPVNRYQAPGRLIMHLSGSPVDVLAFHPRAARELLHAVGGNSRLHMELVHPPFSEFKLTAEILQQQWCQILGVELALIVQDVHTFVQTMRALSYGGSAVCGEIGPYVDPSFFLDMFTSKSAASGCDWFDSRYDAMTADAGAMPDRVRRLEKLAECEAYLLQAMPFVPLCTVVWPSLAKPFIKGLGINLLDGQHFKYAWIDTNWRPS